MAKLPAFQFYPGDWHRDVGVQSLDHFTRNVWFEMILLMHESEERGVLVLNGKPMTNSALAQALHLDNQNLESRLTIILEHGVASRRESDGAIYCRRMVRDESLRKLRQKCGKMGGNPNLVNQNPTTGVKQKPTPSSSSSSSDINNPLPPSRGQRRTALRDQVPVVIPASLNTEEFKKSWEGLIANRKERKQKFVPTSQVRLLARFEKWGVVRSVAAIEHSIANGWTGIYEPQNGAAPTNGRPPPDTHARYGTVRRCISCEQGPIDRHEIYCPACRKRDNDILAERAAKTKDGALK